MVLVESRGILVAPRDDDVPQSVVELSVREQLEDGQGTVSGQARIVSVVLEEEEEKGGMYMLIFIFCSN